MQTFQLTKEVNLIGHFDVVVCGGGCSGFVAAISAAREGKKVALIERYGFIGGTATGGYVVPISGFFFKGKRVVGGIAWEFVKLLEEEGAALVELPKGHISYNPECYKRVAEQMLVNEGVSLFTNSYITDCITEGNKLTHIVFESKNGSEALSADCFIDSTGDGDVFYKCGCDFLQNSKTNQPLSLCFVLSNVDTSTYLLRDCIHHTGAGGKGSKNTEIASYLSSLYAEGKAPKFGGPWFNAILKGDSLAVNITRANANAIDREDYSAAERQLRRDMFTIVELLRKKYPEFKNCEIVSSAINAGVRETRHIKGVYTLTLEDFNSGKLFDCPVAHSAHPMDIHIPTDEKQILIPLENDCFVPYESMVSEKTDNLIAACRCISAEEGPYASLRVQATLMSIGEAAGIAASLVCDTGLNVRDIPKDKLKNIIDKRGFVL